jgi:EAL domain-containing protein (putative c-di-GMP-specific phosphodiesterase class I)
MGKSLQPLNAMAVRPPANTPAASAAPAASEPVTAESMGWQLRAALPPLRLHSVSLYDEQANVLWLSEGALGPDEHNLVLEAMDTLSSDRSMPCYENGLEDGRVAIFLPVRAPQGDLVGVAMILADLKSVSDGVLERIVSPQVRTIIQKIAVLLRASSKSPSAEAPAPIPVAVAPVLELAPDRTSPSARAAANAPAAAPAPAKEAKAASPAAAKPVSNGKAAAPAVAPAPAPLASKQASAAEDAALSPQAIDDILEFELFPEVASAAPTDKKSPSKATPAAPQAPALAWDDSAAGLELVQDEASSAPQSEVAKPAPPPAVVSPRASAPSTKAPPPVVSTTHAAIGLGSLEPPIPIAAAAPPANVPTLSAAAPAAIPVVAPAITAPSDAPVALAAPAASSAGAGSNDALSTTAVSLALPSSAGSNATSAAGAGAAKSTNATTTTRALSSVVSTGTARALNGSAAAGVPVLNATGTTRALSFDPSSLILDVQPFSKLRAGGRMRRYEVLPRIPHRDANRAPAAMDGLALQRLLGWLGSNRSSWSMEPTSFSLNLSISTLEDPKFPQQVASCLKANGIAPDNLGFEIAEPLCTQHRAQVERFLSLCDKLGCFVVIDDFSFDSSVVPLLRSKALRLVKIDPKLTSVALKDKLSQAMVVAIVQAVKVLGIHCAAKRVESQASLQWLTAIGCDLAQGPALSQVLPIESLNMPQTPAPAAEPSKAG